MPKVICGAVDCKWNGEDCECNADKIHLGDHYINTAYDGVKHFAKCHKYKMSEESKRLRDALFAGEVCYSKRSIHPKHMLDVNPKIIE